MGIELEKEIEKKVEAADFPNNFKRVVDLIGVKHALQLVKNSGGINQYIPMYDCVTTSARDRLIREEFDENNYQALALKYRVTEVWVRMIIDKERRKKAKDDLRKNQVSLGF